MIKGIRFALTLAVMTTLLWIAAPNEAKAQYYNLENASSHKVVVALLVPTKQGWFVSQWYTLSPYSRKKVTLNWAQSGKFGFYAQSVNNRNVEWKGNSVAIVSSKASGHPYNKNPGGNNVRKAGFIIKNGNSIKLTVKNEGPRYKNSGGGGSSNPPGNW